MRSKRSQREWLSRGWRRPEPPSTAGVFQPWMVRNCPSRHPCAGSGDPRLIVDWRNGDPLSEIDDSGCQLTYPKGVSVMMIPLRPRAPSGATGVEPDVFLEEASRRSGRPTSLRPRFLFAKVNRQRGASWTRLKWVSYRRCGHGPIEAGSWKVGDWFMSWRGRAS